MKVFEIINEAGLVKTQATDRPVNQPFDLRKMGKRTMKAFHAGDGGGAYARGEPDPKDPFKFKKMTRQPSNLQDDAYYKFIEFIQDQAGDNPFLPVVYMVSTQTDPNDLKKVEYSLQKLWPLDKAYDRTGGELLNIFVEKYLKDPSELENKKFKDYNQFHPMGAFVEYISTMLWQHDFDNFKNPQMVEALKVIERFLAKNPEFKEDLHMGNIMVNFGPGGPQLVFSDPVQDQGRSIVGYNTFTGGWPEGQFPVEPVDQIEDYELETYLREITHQMRMIRSDIVTEERKKLNSTPPGFSYQALDQVTKQKNALTLFFNLSGKIIEKFEKVETARRFISAWQQENNKQVLTTDIPKIIFQMVKSIGYKADDKLVRPYFDLLDSRINEIKLR